MKLVEYLSVAKKGRWFEENCESTGDIYVCSSQRRTAIYDTVSLLLRASIGYTSHYVNAQKVDDLLIINRKLNWPTAVCRIYFTNNRVYTATCTGVVCEDLVFLIRLAYKRYRIRHLKVPRSVARACLESLAWLRVHRKNLATISYIINRFSEPE